jgi:long-chain acyl-CoA synthetase
VCSLSFHQALPKAELPQTYGLSEIGILLSKSESSNSLWVKLGGEGFQTRVANGLLEIKSASAMCGYLNAESPFTEDGWLKTGDMIEEKNGYFRVLGRKSEIINVGGEKVFPAEVESILQKIEGVTDVCVYGEPNAITGNIVAAKICLNTTESLPEFRQRMIEFCRNELPIFKIPQKVRLATDTLHGGRFKKIRNPVAVKGI